MDYSILKNGKPLDSAKYTIDEENKTFSSDEGYTIRPNSKRPTILASEIQNNTINTGSCCTIKTGDNCTFKTSNCCSFQIGHYCTIKAASCCDFETGGKCIFRTDAHCSFQTSSNCHFITTHGCQFETGENCTFNTTDECTFKTKDNCSFNVHYNCRFLTGENCVIIRRDMFEVILPKIGQLIKLNYRAVKDCEIITHPVDIRNILKSMRIRISS